MELIDRTEGDVTVISLSGRMVLTEVDVKLRSRFKELLDEGRRNFVLNLVDVPFLDSAGVGELVTCAKRAYERGGGIRIVLSPWGKTRDIFKATGLDRAFELYAHEQGAIDSFE